MVPLSDQSATETRMGIIREIVEWLRDAPQIRYMAHSTSGFGLAQRTRAMTVSEAADELERQIEAGTA